MLLIWLDIVERRNNLPSRLSQTTARVDMKGWPAPVIRLLLGEITPAELLAAAEDPDPKTQTGPRLRGEFLQRRVCLVARG